MRTITITTYSSMPGRYKITHAQQGKVAFGRDARDAGEAAAIALNYATQNCSGGSYVIVGIKTALDMIPENLRFKP